MQRITFFLKKATSKYQAKIIYMFLSSDPDGLSDMLA